MALSYYCLINAQSGGHQGRKLLEELESIFSSGLYRGRVEAVDFADLPQQLANALPFDRLLIGGGDGTFSTVLGAAAQSKLKLVVGLMPLGTGNDLAREYGLSPKLRDARAKNILEYYDLAGSRTHQLWSLAYGQDYGAEAVFANYVSFGFDGEVIRQFASWRQDRFYSLIPASRKFNRVLYFCACNLYCWSRHLGSEVGIVIDDKRQTIASSRFLSLVVPNISSVMGLGWTNSLSDPGDQTVELVLTRNLFDYFLMLLSSLTGKKRGYFPQCLGQGRKIELEFASNLLVQVDGEARQEIDGRKVLISPYATVELLV